MKTLRKRFYVYKVESRAEIDFDADVHTGYDGSRAMQYRVLDMALKGDSALDFKYHNDRFVVVEVDAALDMLGFHTHTEAESIEDARGLPAPTRIPKMPKVKPPRMDRDAVSPQNCFEIVAEYLAKNGFDGLYNENAECGCEVTDPYPCCENFGACRPGYKVACDCGDHDFHIEAEKNNAPMGEAKFGEMLKDWLFCHCAGCGELFSSHTRKNEFLCHIKEGDVDAWFCDSCLKKMIYGTGDSVVKKVSKQIRDEYRAFAEKKKAEKDVR